VTSAEFLRWSALAERRARAGWWTSPLAIAVIAGAAIAGWVAWRQDAAGFGAGSNGWLAAALVAYFVAFMRVPFHLYWRTDAALLAQLPIEGGPLFDAALVRCVRAAATTTLAVVLGVLPLAQHSLDLALRHAAFAGALGMAAAGLLPAVATWAAMLVAIGQRDDRVQKARAAAGISASSGPPSTAALGALPGFAATVVVVLVLLGYGWLTARTATLPAPLVLAAIAVTSGVAIVAARRSARHTMGTILRDVSALDRQRLAHLEIHPPTALERALAKLAGDGALAYAKDARLVRRRFPMAFALGALAFLVLAIVGLARPDDPAPWLASTLGGATIYGIALAGRLWSPPIELPRLTATLPLAAAAIARAKLVWIAGWWTIFVAAPGLFAALRQPEPLPGLALVGAGTVIVLAAGVVRKR